MPTYGLANTATNLMTRPYGGVSPIGPAGMTDMQRQGMMTQLQGMGSQYQPAQQYAQNMGNLAQQSAGSFNRGMSTGAFGWNPQMQSAYNMAGASAQPNALQGAGALSTVAGMNPQLYNSAQQGFANATNQPGFGQGGNMLNNASWIAANSMNQPGFAQANAQTGNAMNQPGFAQANAQTGNAMNQPGFGLAANAVGSTLGSYGGGYSTGMANTINTTGASFDPYKNPALAQSVSAANRALGRDFNQAVMPAMNRGAIGAGSGGYGGARAGIAQGIREQGLADAMSRQTSDMMSRGYETGLNRYVQDRGQTVNATLEALKQGGYLGMQGANILGNIANMQGQLGMQGANLYGNLANMQGQLGMQGANMYGNLANMQGNLGQTAASNIGNFGSAMGNLANQQGNLGLGAAQGQAGIANSMAGNFLQGGNQLGNMGNQQAANMYNAANLRGQLGQNSLAQNNDMYRFGFGQMLPNAYGGAYEAGLQPGQVMQGMGQAMQGYGQQQQMNNQNRVDWYNNQFNAAQAYPQNRFNAYVGNMGPILQPGTSGTSSQTTPGNPLAGAIGGASAGYGLYDAWRNSQQANT